MPPYVIAKSVSCFKAFTCYRAKPRCKTSCSLSYIDGCRPPSAASARVTSSTTSTGAAASDVAGMLNLFMAVHTALNLITIAGLLMVVWALCRATRAVDAR